MRMAIIYLVVSDIFNISYKNVDHAEKKKLSTSDVAHYYSKLYENVWPKCDVVLLNTYLSSFAYINLL